MYTIKTIQAILIFVKKNLLFFFFCRIKFSLVEALLFLGVDITSKTSALNWNEKLYSYSNDELVSFKDTRDMKIG